MGLTTTHENGYAGCRRPSERVDSQLVQEPEDRLTPVPGGTILPRKDSPAQSGSTLGRFFKRTGVGWAAGIDSESKEAVWSCL